MASLALPLWMQDLVAEPAREGPLGVDLMGRLARRDAGVFEQVVRTCRPQVERLARRLLGWEGDVEDVVQEVFLAVLEKAPRFRGESSLETWITAITVNKCRSHRRSWLRRLRFMQRTQERAGPDVVDAADSSAMTAEVFGLVRSALEALSAKDREVVVLYHLEQLPVDQVARVLGVKKNAAEVRLHRARQKLRGLLEDLIEEP